MDKILPSYNDPLFSILIIITLILIVAIASYIMGNYKEDREKRSLKRFLGTIEADNECQLDMDKLPFDSSLINPLSLLAERFSTQGEYQKAITIYLYLINNIQLFREKEYLLEGLGETYLRAGFLKRSESIFLEILQKHPRNRAVLYYLEVVYELLNEYNRAEEIIVPLQILKENTQSLEIHIKILILLKSSTITKEIKIKRLKEFIEYDPKSYRRVIKELFKLDENSAWSILDMDKINLILDILWFLPSSKLNFDIILSNDILRNIYIAKGVIENNKNSINNSGIFAIDTINYAKLGGKFDIDLNFNYGCSRCKHHFPISFDRCPNCYAINSIQVKESVGEKKPYSQYSLL